MQKQFFPPLYNDFITQTGKTCSMISLTIYLHLLWNFMTIIPKVLRNFWFEWIEAMETKNSEFEKLGSHWVNLSHPLLKRIIPQVEVDPRYRYTTYNTIHHCSLIICSIHFCRPWSPWVNLPSSFTLNNSTLVDKHLTTNEFSRRWTKF